MQIGDRIKKLRTEAGMTQEELASKINVGKSSISMYENNKIRPDDDLKQKLCDIFNVTLDYLMGRSILKTPEERIAFHLEDDELDPDDVALIQNLIESLKKKHKNNP